MEEVLKPCPYCASDTCECFPVKDSMFQVACSECFMRGSRYASQDEAIAAWNALPRRLRWTKEWPQDYHPGHYYLFCFPPSKTSICRYVDVPPDELKSEMIRDWPHLSPQQIENIEWAGPIPEPEAFQ